jgi:hypothetical protein
MNHIFFLKRLLNQGATYFGVFSFIIALVIVPFLDVANAYVSNITYFAGMAALYFASYKVWLYDRAIENISKPKVEVMSAKGIFVNGTGKTFHNSNVIIELCFINDSTKSVAFTNFKIVSNLNSSGVTLDENFKLINDSESIKSVKSINLAPNESKVFSLESNLKTNFKEPLETAIYLQQFDGNNIEFHFEAITDGSRESKFVKCSVSLEALISRFKIEWKRQNETEAIARLSNKLT